MAGSDIPRHHKSFLFSLKTKNKRGELSATVINDGYCQVWYQVKSNVYWHKHTRSWQNYMYKEMTDIYYAKRTLCKHTVHLLQIRKVISDNTTWQ